MTRSANLDAAFLWLLVALTLTRTAGQFWDPSGANRLNPITYYGFTQPYYSGFYGGIGAMPYMSGWQASIYGGQPDAMSLLAAGQYGMSGTMSGFGMPGWNAAPVPRPFSTVLIGLTLSIALLLGRISR